MKKTIESFFSIEDVLEPQKTCTDTTARGLPLGVVWAGNPTSKLVKGLRIGTTDCRAATTTNARSGHPERTSLILCFEVFDVNVCDTLMFF
jgi:hypothetical protein